MMTLPTVKGTSANRLSPEEIEKRLARGKRLWDVKERGGNMTELGEQLGVKKHDRADYAIVASVFAEGNPSKFPLRYVTQLPWVVMQYLTRSYLDERYRFELASLVLYSVERDWLGQTPSQYSIPATSNAVSNLTRTDFEKYAEGVHILFAHMKKERHEELTAEERGFLLHAPPDIIAASTPHIPVLGSATQKTVIDIPAEPHVDLDSFVKASVETAISQITKAFTPDTFALDDLTNKITALEDLLEKQVEQNTTLTACIDNLSMHLSDARDADELRMNATMKAKAIVEEMREILARKNTAAPTTYSTVSSSDEGGPSDGAFSTVTGETDSERHLNDAIAGIVTGGNGSNSSNGQEAQHGGDTSHFTSFAEVE
jgi:hypothetical protein